MQVALAKPDTRHDQWITDERDGHELGMCIEAQKYVKLIVTVREMKTTARGNRIVRKARKRKQILD